MKIVIAPQSFKGSLSATEVAQAIAKGVRAVYPHADLVMVPVADGGDGTLDILINSGPGGIRTDWVADPLNRKTLCRWGVLTNKIAIIELAQICGLSKLKPEEYNPSITTTFGFGEIINKALNEGFRQFWVGLGGSATNDAGTGFARALGALFLDKNGLELPLGGGFLGNLNKIELDHCNPLIKEAKFITLTDVFNSLMGQEGASLLYSIQKGASPEMAKQLEEGMIHFANIVKRDFNIDLGQIRGAGAAGGTGAGMLLFLRSQLVSGAEFILEKISFEQALSGADLVITGEGRLDEQTFFNKAPMGVALKAKMHDISVIAIVGALDGIVGEKYHEYFNAIFPISTPGLIPQNSEELLAKTTEKALRSWKK